MEKINTPWKHSVSRGHWKDERNELIEKIQRGNVIRGFLVALAIIYGILAIFSVQTSAYGWAVLVCIGLVALRLLVGVIFERE